MLGRPYLEQELAQFTQPLACSPGSLTTRAQQEADTSPRPQGVSLAGGPHLCAPAARGGWQSSEELLSALQGAPSALHAQLQNTQGQALVATGAPERGSEPLGGASGSRLLPGAGKGTEGKRWAGHINPHVAMARLVWRWSSFRCPPTLPALQRAVPNSFEILSLLFPRLPFFVFSSSSFTHLIGPQ